MNYTLNYGMRAQELQWVINLIDVEFGFWARLWPLSRLRAIVVERKEWR